ncbi:hypothetical protein MMC16_000914 [Acarospora aff. strigata]|nr:hypothetical protein [Acarospora aff. strigata]
MSGNLYVDPNFPNPGGENDASIIIYGYTPSFALAVLGATLFAVSTLLHTVQAARYRTWYFLPLPIGCVLEIVGYIARALSARKSPYNIIYFVIQYFFIVVAPVFFSAAIYTVLSMMINAVGRAYSPFLRPKAILWIFVVCDVIATVVQVAGAAMIGSAESKRKDPTTANNILLAGLAFQVFSFFVFLVLLAVFLRRARKVAATTMMPFTFALVSAALLVYLRTCFRLAETAQGLMGQLSSREVYFGCLEFAPVVLAVWIFNVWHPGKWVPRYN